MGFEIKPAFDRIANAVMIMTEEINYLLNSQYNDKFGFYQETFGLYSYMQLTADKKFRIHYPQGHPLTWQPHNSCSWTPTGTLAWGTDLIEPCKVKLNEENCYDENLVGLFSDFHRWNGSGTIQLSESGQAATNALLNTLLANATIGFRLLGSAGQLYDTGTVEFGEGVSTRIRDAFIRQVNSCPGWISAAITRSAEDGASQLDGGFIQAGDISANGRNFTADVMTLYDDMLAGSTDALQESIIEGAAGSFNSYGFPIWVVSPSLLVAIDAEFKAQQQSALMNQPRISRVPYQTQLNGRAATIYVFMIDNTVVIPLTEIGLLDRYLTGRSHFAYLTLSGVLQLGGSFGSLPPVAGRNNVAVRMQTSTDNEDYGKHTFLSHALTASAINDTDYVTGSYLYAEPA